jgi:hypothetical protein
MIAQTTSRVSENTSEDVNVRIQRQTEESVSQYASAGAEAIEHRLQELDREWNIERALEANAAGFTLAAVVLGIVENRKWFIVPGVLAAFVLQHAIQGWCPPLPLLRRLGLRTETEINRERCALKALRGDFREVEPAVNEQVQQKAAAALRAADR